MVKLERHAKAVRAFWNKLNANGCITKGEHSGFYLSNEESFVPKSEVLYDYTKSQYVHVNSGILLEPYKEINCLFSLGKYKNKLKSIWEDTQTIKIPDRYKQQILSELNNLPEKLSISRPVKRIPWGIIAPEEDQTVYVWIDALINYYTVQGYPDKVPNENNEFANVIHVLGKDIIRFHAIIWPALLLANNYPLPKELMIHDFWLLRNVNCCLNC